MRESSDAGPGAPARPEARSTGAGRDWILGLSIAAVALALYVPLRYRAGLVEPDGVRVGFGIVHAIRSGEGFAARDLYGRAFSFGYYALFIALYPRLSGDFRSLAASMNGLNTVCVAASLLPLVLWMSALWGRRVAAAAAALMATTPVLFELGGYGHPTGPAFFFLNAGLALFLRGLRARPRAAPALLSAAAASAFAAAAFRADMMLAFPLFPLLAPLARAGAGASRPRARAIAAGLAVVGAAGLGFFAAQQAVLARTPPRALPVAGGRFTGEVNAIDLLLEYWAISTRARSLAKGVAVWACGLGPLLLAAGAAGVVAAFRRGQRAFALAAAAVLLPNAAFWLPNPTPSRHFLLTALALVPAAALWLEARVPPRRFALAAVLLVLLNLASMAAAYPVLVRGYAFAFVSLLPRRVSLWVPMGDPLSNRRWVERQVALEESEAHALAAAGEPRLLVLGSSVPLRLVYELFATSPSYAVDYVRIEGASLRRVRTPKTDYLIYDYGGGEQTTPRDLLKRIEAAGALRDFAVAIVPSDQLAADPAEVPPGYRAFEFGAGPAEGHAGAASGPR